MKVYNLETYSVIHHLTYPAPVLCMAVSVSAGGALGTLAHTSKTSGVKKLFSLDL